MTFCTCPVGSIDRSNAVHEPYCVMSGDDLRPTATIANKLLEGTMSARLYRAVERAKEVLSERDLESYLNVIAQALEIHAEKETIRRGLWKDYPARDQTFQVKIKAERVLNTLQQEAELSLPEVKNAVEEYCDIINYSVFGVRILEGTAQK